MKKTIKYLGVESIKYEFTPYEIEEALCKTHNIVREGKEISFYVDEDGAEIIIRIETEKGKKNESRD